MLKVQNITKSYGKTTILDNISFQVEDGTIIGLVGENGAGKSTLLNMIATLTKPSKGTIQLGDLDARKNKKKYRAKVGYIPQDIAVWEQFTVEENMRFFEKLSWIRKSNDELKQLCLDMELNKWKEPVHTLSGGQKRKLNMAISLIHEPKLLLLDEPTVGIDMKSKAEIIHYLQKITDEKDMVIMYTSHDMTEIQELCDHVICIGEDPFYKNMLEQTEKNVVSF